MKGFVYLLEISIALLLLLAVLTTFHSFSSGEKWERAVLIEAGDNILKMVRNGDLYKIAEGDTIFLEDIIPKNMNYSFKIYGIPKSVIRVGCVRDCDYLESVLTPALVNKRWVNFSVEYFDIESINYIPSYYDAVVLINYTNYVRRRNNITDYISKGGVVIALNATKSTSNPSFNGIFDLKGSSASSSLLQFAPYNPSWDETEKYFLGFGFDTGNSSSFISYDTGNFCLEGSNPGINGDEYVTFYGDAGFWISPTEPITTNCHSSPWGSYYVTDEFFPATPGVLVIRTPYIPADGYYVVNYDELKGTPGQINNENYTIKCGGQTFFIPDDDDDGTEDWEWKGVTCYFNEGVNYVNITSMPGAMSIQFDTFKISGNAAGSNTNKLYVWEVGRDVTINSDSIDIENITVDEGLLTNLYENDTFQLKGPDSSFYKFRIKKITPDRVDIQPMGTNFKFLDFSEHNIISGSKNILLNSQNSFAGMSTNNTAIWLSDFQWSDEYRTLLKASIASNVKEINIGEVDTTKDYAAVSSFYSLCCDMPEIAKLTIYLWYKI